MNENCRIYELRLMERVAAADETDRQNKKNNKNKKTLTENVKYLSPNT